VGADPGSRAWTPVWLLLALAWWTALGGGAGLALSLAGRLGRRVLNGLAWPVAGLLRGVGLKGLAGLFTFS
ncbi:MAG TPA: hypothetical protein VFA26_17395, partial [Gemmataceae bacterium]|nr:hypothetical protein [Gemmataceae bacterium]